MLTVCETLTDLTRQRHRLLLLAQGLSEREIQQLVSSIQTLYNIRKTIPIHQPFESKNRSQHALGSDEHVQVLDFRSSIDPGLLGTMAGTVEAGGMLLLLVPVDTVWESSALAVAPWMGSREVVCQDAGRYIKKWSDSLIAYEQKRAINSENVAEYISGFDECDRPDLAVDGWSLNSDQESLIESVMTLVNKQDKALLLITSRRGRGKSTAVSEFVSRINSTGKKTIAICARSKATVAKYYLYKSGEKFYPPDYLLENQVIADVLVIEEAATIPFYMLIGLIKKYSITILVTTLDGYEGTGQAISTRLSGLADQLGLALNTLELEKPVRWAATDPLEGLVCNLLHQHFGSHNPLEEQGRDLNFTLTWCRKPDVLNEAMLEQAIYLLEAAHYRTRPEDIWQWYDDPDIRILVAVGLHGSVIGVCCLQLEEVDWSESLKDEIFAGNRRPGGYLAHQTLLFQLGIKEAADLKLARIVRIAVQPGMRRKSIASALVEEVRQTLSSEGVDLLTASFGITGQTLDFWEAMGLKMTRIGFRSNPMSGEVSAFMHQGLSKAGKSVAGQIENSFACAWNAAPQSWKNVISEDIKKRFDATRCTNNYADSLSETDRKFLRGFCDGNRSVENTIVQLKTLYRFIQSDKAISIGSDLMLWEMLLENGFSSVEVSERLSMHSKKMVVSQFRREVKHALERLQY